MIRDSLPGREVEIETAHRHNNGLKDNNIGNFSSIFQILPLFNRNLSDTEPKYIPCYELS